MMVSWHEYTFHITGPTIIGFVDGHFLLLDWTNDDVLPTGTKWTNRFAEK